jgi:FkbM family methyltransferase
MCSLIEPGDTIVDAGAFIGTHTLAFGQKVGFDGRVLAFEPTKESFYCLTGNIMINNVYKVEAMQIALGKEEGILDLVSVGNVNKPNNYGGLGSIDYSTNETTYITKKVKMKALDSFNLTECKLIKIDVEGMSLEVLEGAKNTIEKCRPCIFTEVDDFKHQKKLIKFMKNFGYNAYDATSPLFNPNNYFKNPNNIFPGIVSFAIFCCPNDWNTTGLPKLD